MVIPKTVARFNKHVTNHVSAPTILQILDFSDFLSMRPEPAP